MTKSETYDVKVGDRLDVISGRYAGRTGTVAIRSNAGFHGIVFWLRFDDEEKMSGMFYGSRVAKTRA